MSQANSVDNLLTLAQWHVSRADGQRAGIWTRAGALLSADSLIIAGAAILITRGGEHAALLAIEVVPLTASIVSIYFASTLLRSGVASHRALLEGLPRRASVYSLTDLAAMSDDFASFKEGMLTKSLETELEDALVEIWRLSILQSRRMKRLTQALRWFLVGSASLFAAATAVLVAGLA